MQTKNLNKKEGKSQQKESKNTTHCGKVTTKLHEKLLEGKRTRGHRDQFMFEGANQSNK